MAVGKTKRRSRVAILGRAGVGWYYADLLARTGKRRLVPARGAAFAALPTRNTAHGLAAFALAQYETLESK